MHSAPLAADRYNYLQCPVLSLIWKVVALAEDTTYLACPKSNDPSTQVSKERHTWSHSLFPQADFYSGRKNHGQCVQIGNITDPTGHCWAILPGRDSFEIHTLVLYDFKVFKQAAFHVSGMELLLAMSMAHGLGRDLKMRVFQAFTEGRAILVPWEWLTQVIVFNSAEITC